MWPQGSECTVQQECGSIWSFFLDFGFCFVLVGVLFQFGFTTSVA